MLCICFLDAYFFLFVRSVPGPPYILSDRQYTDLIDVDFAKPCEQNGEILGYRVQYQEYGQRLSDPIKYPATQRRIRVSGLRQQTRFVYEQGVYITFMRIKMQTKSEKSDQKCSHFLQLCCRVY